MDRGVLRHDRDAAFALEVDVVERALGHALVYAEHAALMEEGIYQRGLAVVHVGNDGDIPPERVGDRRGGARQRRHPPSISSPETPAPFRENCD